MTSLTPLKVYSSQDVHGASSMTSMPYYHMPATLTMTFSTPLKAPSSQASLTTSKMPYYAPATLTMMAFHPIHICLVIPMPVGTGLGTGCEMPTCICTHPWRCCKHSHIINSVLLVGLPDLQIPNCTTTKVM